jgi:hypothetical protein
MEKKQGTLLTQTHYRGVGRRGAFRRGRSRKGSAFSGPHSPEPAFVSRESVESHGPVLNLAEILLLALRPPRGTTARRRLPPMRRLTVLAMAAAVHADRPLQVGLEWSHIGLATRSRALSVCCKLMDNAIPVHRSSSRQSAPISSTGTPSPSSTRSKCRASTRLPT